MQLARLAEASGNTLDSVLQFQYSALSRRGTHGGQAAEDSASPDADPYQDVRRYAQPMCLFA